MALVRAPIRGPKTSHTDSLTSGCGPISDRHTVTLACCRQAQPNLPEVAERAVYVIPPHAGRLPDHRQLYTDRRTSPFRRDAAKPIQSATGRGLCRPWGRHRTHIDHPHLQRRARRGRSHAEEWAAGRPVHTQLLTYLRDQPHSDWSSPGVWPSRVAVCSGSAGRGAGRARVSED